MAFQVGSLANLINQKSLGKTSSTKLFQNISKSANEVHFKVLPTAKRKRISEDDPDNVTKKRKKYTSDDEDNFHPQKSKKLEQDNTSNAARRLHGLEPKVKERVVNPEEDKRTIFVGNLPCNIKTTKLKKLFKSYGEIESARLRCPPVKDPRIPKRVAAIRKEFHPDRSNIVGYIRFASEEEAMAALAVNGLLYNDHHLRVDLSTNSRTHDQKRAVFVGNLHFGAEENDLWNIFESCGQIEGIRIIRDSRTGVGKGFAYVNFKDLSAVELALKLDGQELKDRPIRVSRAAKKAKGKKLDPRTGKKVKGQVRRQKNVEKWLENKKKFRKDDEEVERTLKVRKPKLNKGKHKTVEKASEEEGKEEFESTQKTLKRSKLKFKPKSSKDKSNKAKKISEEGPSYLGCKVDDNSKVKSKKKKLSKAELKKQVLAFQLQLKKGGISYP